MHTPSSLETNRRAWLITCRWHEYEGELRTALLRVILVAAFYAIALGQRYIFSSGDAAAARDHRILTAMSIGWLCLSLLVLVALQRRFFPSWLKYLTCGGDILLLTGIIVGVSGPTSPLIGGYGLIIATAALRFRLGLIWFSTLASMIAFLFLVGWADPSWFDADHVTSPARQLITLLSLASTGAVLGQLLRMVRDSAEQYQQRWSEQATQGPSR